VANAIRVEQRYQDIDVWQGGTVRCGHDSSRRRLTNTSVDPGLPNGRRRNSGTPLRTAARIFGTNALRDKEDLSGRRAALLGELLRGLQHVRIDIEGYSHRVSITHQTSTGRELHSQGCLRTHGHILDEVPARAPPTEVADLFVAADPA